MQDRKPFGSILTLIDGLSDMCRFTRKVYLRLLGKGNSDSHGARPVHQIISMIE